MRVAVLASQPLVQGRAAWTSRTPHPASCPSSSPLGTAPASGLERPGLFPSKAALGRAPGAGQGSSWGAGCCSVGSGLRVSPTRPKGFPQARSIHLGLKREDARASPLRRAFASPASRLPRSLQGRGSQIPNFSGT